MTKCRQGEICGPLYGSVEHVRYKIKIITVGTMAIRNLEEMVTSKPDI